MSNDKQKPVEVIRDGNLSASIWQRQNGKDTYYATTYAKSYRDENGEYQTSHSFYGTDHLKLAELCKQAYQRERELHYRDKQAERDNNKPHSRDNDRER